MMLLDRLFKRQPAAPQTRRFDGAAGGRRGFGMGTFGPINPEVMAAGSTLRSRARYLAANNPWLCQGAANWAGALVGSGIVPTGSLEAVASFNEWATAADAEGRTDFWGLQSIVARALVIDGESFVQIIATEVGPRLRVIPAELVDEAYTVELAGGGYAVSGIEFDATGQRVAYHVFPAKPTAAFQTYSAAIRVPADEILHIFKPVSPGQVRGVTWLAPAILPASELDQLCDALLMGAKIAAMHAGFVTNQNATGGDDPFEGQDSPSLEPGTLLRLAGGWDVKFNSPQQVSQIEPFVRLNLLQLAAALGLPDHLLSGDLSGANYSSLRAGLLPFRQRVEQVQYHTLVPQLLTPVWREVIAWAAANGGIPNFEAKPEEALRVEWLPPRPLQVDPQKDTEATILEIENGLTSRRKAVAERGWNMADLDAEIAADTFKKGGQNA